MSTNRNIRRLQAIIADKKDLINSLLEQIDSAKKTGNSSYSLEQELRRQRNEVESLKKQIRA